MTTYPTEIRGAETDTRGITDRFGGIDTPAAMTGTLAALGGMVFLSSLIAAGAGGIDYQINAIDFEGNAQEIAIGGAIAGLLVVFASFFVGGWAAGRIARFNGAMNGFGSALWMLLLVAIFAALGAFFGAEYNAFQQAELPDWFSQFSGDEVTTTAVIAGVAFIVIMFGGATLGGAVGERYNRRVDAALTDNATRRTDVHHTEETTDTPIVDEDSIATDDAVATDRDLSDDRADAVGTYRRADRETIDDDIYTDDTDPTAEPRR